MPLLLLDDPNAIDSEDEFRVRIVAAEACCVPKQTNNDEGRPQDLQISVPTGSGQFPVSASTGTTGEPTCHWIR
jgi:hypothetical protein